MEKKLFKFIHKRQDKDIPEQLNEMSNNGYNIIEIRNVDNDTVLVIYYDKDYNTPSKFITLRPESNQHTIVPISISSQLNKMVKDGYRIIKWETINTDTVLVEYKNPKIIKGIIISNTVLTGRCEFFDTLHLIRDHISKFMKDNYDCTIQDSNNIRITEDSMQISIRFNCVISASRSKLEHIKNDLKDCIDIICTDHIGNVSGMEYTNEITLEECHE